MIIGIDRPLTLQLFKRSLREILGYSEFVDDLSCYELADNVGYVATVLADSVLMPLGHGLGNFWTFRHLGDVESQYLHNAGTPDDAFQARSEAEQVLIMVGLRWKGSCNRYSRAVTEKNIELLENTGQALYDIAAEEFPVVEERSTFATMSETFHSWTKVLSRIQVHESIAQIR